MKQLPRWVFTFGVNDTEPRSFYTLGLAEISDPEVKAYTIGTSVINVLRVSVSHDSYDTALHDAIDVRMEYEAA